MPLNKIQQLKKKLNSQQRQLTAYYQHVHGQDNSDYQIQTITVKLQPNQTMFKYMYNLAYWRNYWWNEGLDLLKAELANYEIAHMNAKDHTLEDKAMARLNKWPTEQRLRNELVANKSETEYALSARSLQLTIKDLFQAFTSHRNQPDHFKMPKFKTFQQIQPNFKSDRVRIMDDKLILDKPRQINSTQWFPIKMHGFRSDLNYKNHARLVLTSFYLKNGQWFANLAFHVMPHQHKHKNNSFIKTTGVDLNVHQFVDSQHLNDDGFDPCPNFLDKYYKQLSWIDHRIARRKRLNKQLSIKQSHRLNKLLRQRQHLYRQIKFIQTDLCQKYTSELVNTFTDITIEDLNVKAMQVSHRCKNTQRAMFGIFRQILTYKADWYGITLNIANRFYPSTQRCSTCGHIKTGDNKISLNGNQKHHTKHNQYICYNPNCPNYLIDQGRDQNAEENLNQLNFYYAIARLMKIILTC